MNSFVDYTDYVLRAYGSIRALKKLNRILSGHDKKNRLFSDKVVDNFFCDENAEILNELLKNKGYELDDSTSLEWNFGESGYQQEELVPHGLEEVINLDDSTAGLSLTELSRKSHLEIEILGYDLGALTARHVWIYRGKVALDETRPHLLLNIPHEILDYNPLRKSHIAQFMKVNRIIDTEQGPVKLTTWLRENGFDPEYILPYWDGYGYTFHNPFPRIMASAEHPSTSIELGQH